MREELTAGDAPYAGLFPEYNLAPTGLGSMLKDPLAVRP
jgi:hypothetical protein